LLVQSAILFLGKKRFRNDLFYFYFFIFGIDYFFVFTYVCRVFSVKRESYYVEWNVKPVTVNILITCFIILWRFVLKLT